MCKTTLSTTHINELKVSQPVTDKEKQINTNQANTPNIKHPSYLGVLWLYGTGAGSF